MNAFPLIMSYSIAGHRLRTIARLYKVSLRNAHFFSFSSDKSIPKYFILKDPKVRKNKDTLSTSTLVGKILTDTQCRMYYRFKCLDKF